MKGKKVVRILTGIIIIFILIDFITSFYFYHLAIQRGPKDFLKGNDDLEVSAKALDVFLEGDWRDWVAEQPFEEIDLTSYDGLQLKGYLLEARQPSNKVVVMAHGYLGRGSDMGLLGQYYYEELGYNVFMADARGHGQSEGDYIGFGWHDRLDYVDWINRLVDRFGSDTEIVLHGVSMGGATVLMTSGEPLPDQVKAVIADSPYTSVYDMFSYQMSRMFRLPSFPILDSTSLVTQLKAGYSLRKASALAQVKRADVPILYIHGKEDTFVPTRMSKELYEHTNSEAELMIVDGAGHGEAFVLDRERYLQKLHSFLNKHIDS
ncbi:MAG TPA: alpha/beta hydrolase [Bacillota bacterium]